MKKVFYNTLFLSPILLLFGLFLSLSSMDKQQFSYFFLVNPNPHLNKYVDTLISTNHVNFTNLPAVKFICYVSKELSATDSANKFAEEHNLSFNYFFDSSFIRGVNVNAFYLVKSNGDSDIIRYVDTRDFFGIPESRWADKNSILVAHKCGLNDKTYIVRSDDT